MSHYQVFESPPEPFDERLQGAGCYCEYEGKILIIKRHERLRDGGTWCVPGGTREQGETPLQTVVREVYEEVGFSIEESLTEHVGRFYIRLPDIEYVFHTFRYRFLTKPSIDLSLAEHTEALWVTADEAFQFPLIRGGRETLLHYKNTCLSGH